MWKDLLIRLALAENESGDLELERFLL